MKLNFILSIIIITALIFISACNSSSNDKLAPRPDLVFVTVTPHPPLPTMPILQDVALEAGLVFQHGAFSQSLSMDPAAMMGGGLCWLDYNNDGWMDLYVVNSYAKHEAELLRQQGKLPHNALFRNLGNGKFSDVSRGSGADLTMRGNGCIAGDIDLDGDTDIYITADGSNALLLNQNNGVFIESARQAGVAAPEWNTAAALGDIDGDGWPDLYVASFIDLNNTVPQPLGLFPQDYYGLPDHLYRNRGDGTFEDIALQAGLTLQERGLGAIMSDFDQDGDLDLYIANDGNDNRLYLNDGDGNFTDVSQMAGVDDRGSGMGVSAGDYSGDGQIDLMVTNFDKEYHALYQNEGMSENGLTFEYDTFHIEIQGFGQNQTSWGTTWLDLDLDGDLDLMTAQGQVPITDLQADAQLLRYYNNKGEGIFRDFSSQVGLAEVGPRLARGMAAADYDNDGDLDIAVATIGGPLTLLQTTGVSNNWLTVAFDHVYPGTILRATLPNGQTLIRELYIGSSYLSSEDPRFHLGLGKATEITKLEITLPNGRTFLFDNVPANQILNVITLNTSQN